MDVLSASYYATYPGAMGSRFMEILPEEWRGVLDRSWNFKGPLVFYHFILINILGVHRAI